MGVRGLGRRIIPAVERGSGECQRLAQRLHRGYVTCVVDGLQESIASFSGSGIPRISESFFWISMMVSA